MPESNLGSISAGQILYSEMGDGGVGVSICFHEAAQEAIMEMKEDKSHDTDHRVQQEQKSRRGTLWIGALDKKMGRILEPPPCLQTSNKLLERGEQPENSISSHMCHLLSPNYTVLLFRTSQRSSSTPPVPDGPPLSPLSPIFDHVSRRAVARQKIKVVGTHSECAPSHRRQAGRQAGGRAEGCGGRQFVCVSR